MNKHETPRGKNDGDALTHVTSQVHKLGDFVQTPLPFSPPRPPSVAESGAAVVARHRAICEGESTTHRASEKRTERAFIRLPSRPSRKLRKSCQRRGSFPTPGLELWPREVMVMHAARSLHRSGTPKKHRRPRGGSVAYESLCLSVLPSPFFLKISVALA